MKKPQIIRLIISIVVCQLAGVIGSLFTAPAIATWYASLVKPSFTPPSFVFAPVWIALFFLMGISLYLVWDKKPEKLALSMFGAQLILNILWSVLFFGSKNPFLAFIEIIILWLAILATMILFYRISPKAAYLLIPYIVWVTIASFLNYSIFLLN